MKCEAKIQKSILNYLRKECYVFKVIVANRGGVPDIICCIDGQFVAFEVKALGNSATPLQSYNIDEIRKNGGIAYVVRSVDEVQTILSEIKRKKNEGKI